MNRSSLEKVDWSRIPPPTDDGGAEGLLGATLPDVGLEATDGSRVFLGALPGRSVLYAYPMTGRPDASLPEGWDMIPGARGCTPQSCSYRDRFRELNRLGVDQVFGLSTQAPDYQREAAERLHLPFPLLSDAEMAFAGALGLPTMDVEGRKLLKRLTMIIDDGRIVRVNYPVFPPDADAEAVIEWLAANPTAGF